MRAGVAIDKALRAAGRAIGPLTRAWVREEASRSILEQAAVDLEEAAAFIRSTLPPAPPAQYPDSSPGEDQQA